MDELDRRIADAASRAHASVGDVAAPDLHALRPIALRPVARNRRTMVAVAAGLTVIAGIAVTVVLRRDVPDAPTASEPVTAATTDGPITTSATDPTTSTSTSTSTSTTVTELPVMPCTASSLTVRAARREGAMSNALVEILLENVGTEACSLSGYPSLSGLTSFDPASAVPIDAPHGSYFGEPTTRSPALPGERYSVFLGGSNDCPGSGVTPAQPWAALQLTLPDGSTIAFTTDMNDCAVYGISSFGHPIIFSNEPVRVEDPMAATGVAIGDPIADANQIPPHPPAGFDVIPVWLPIDDANGFVNGYVLSSVEHWQPLLDGDAPPSHLIYDEDRKPIGSFTTDGTPIIDRDFPPYRATDTFTAESDYPGSASLYLASNARVIVDGGVARTIWAGRNGLGADGEAPARGEFRVEVGQAILNDESAPALQFFSVEVPVCHSAVELVDGPHPPLTAIPFVCVATGQTGTLDVLARTTKLDV